MVTLLCPQGPEGRQGWAGSQTLWVETYPVQDDMGNLETQNNDPEESQDERLVSVHDVLWPNEGNWHLWAQVARLSHEANVPERMQRNQKSKEIASEWRVLESRLPQPGGPPEREGRGQGQDRDGFLSGWGLGPRPPG